METVWNALMENWVELLEWPAMAVTVLAAATVVHRAVGQNARKCRSVAQHVDWASAKADRLSSTKRDNLKRPVSLDRFYDHGDLIQVRHNPDCLARITVMRSLDQAYDVPRPVDFQVITECSELSQTNRTYLIFLPTWATRHQELCQQRLDFHDYPPKQSRSG